MFDFLDELSSIFDPSGYSYTRSIKESSNGNYYEMPNGFMCVFSVQGVPEEDVHVSRRDIGNNKILFKVTGDHTLKIGKHSVPFKYEYAFTYNTTNFKIDDVQTQVKDGLAYVYIRTSKADKKVSNEVEIPKIGNGKEFDW